VDWPGAGGPWGSVEWGAHDGLWIGIWWRWREILGFVYSDFFFLGFLECLGLIVAEIFEPVCNGLVGFR
jgi:hypothetical protein